MKVKRVEFNFCQVGNIHNGVDPQVESYEVGNFGVTKIIEEQPLEGEMKWNYLVYIENKGAIRIFNPNLVEYFAE